MRVQLLADLQDIFGGDNHASTETLLSKLNAMSDRPWPESSRGKPLTARGLARLLKPFGILSKTVRLSSTDTVKGYERKDFLDAFARYLPVVSVTTSQPAPALAHLDVSHPSHSAVCDASRSATSIREINDCDAVTAGREVVEL